MANETKAVAKRGEYVGTMIQKAMSKIPALLRKNVTPERVAQTFYVALTKTPKLRECTVPSLCMAMIQAELLDVDCSGFTGEAALIPLKNGKTGNTEANLWVMYQGMMKLARKSRQVSHIEARVVYANDEFEWEFGLNPVLKHVPGQDIGDKNITHVYAIARMNGGLSLFEVMRKPEVDKIRSGSRAKDDNAWSNNYSEMARKTVVRRLCKYLPKTPELERAMQLDSSLETGERPPIEIDGEMITFEEETDLFAPGEHKPEKDKKTEKEPKQPQEAPESPPESSSASDNGRRLAGAIAAIASGPEQVAETIQTIERHAETPFGDVVSAVLHGKLHEMLSVKELSFVLSELNKANAL